MFKLIILFVLLAVSFYVVRLVLGNRKRGVLLRKPAFKKNHNNKQNNKMVRCISCGLHVPEQEAIKQGDKIFCSLKHANQRHE
jgi:uncharacterized protein